MAFYFSSETMAFYDTDVFPVDSLPANKVEITEAVYNDLLTKQNQGYVIKADNSGNPYAVAQGEAAATDMKHSGSIATTLALGHVKIGNTMQTANDGTLDLKDWAVTTAKIVDANVTADKLASNAVTTAKIADSNVTTAKIADENVTTAKIADSGVTTAKIANQNVTTDKLADGATTTAKIADSGVTTAKIANQNVTTAKIADSGVTTAKIANQNVTTDKLADGSVTEAKLDSVKELVADETTLTMDEDANVFTLSVKDGGIGTQEIADRAVTTAKIADQNVTTAKIADSGVTTDKIANKNVTHKKLDSQFLYWDPSWGEHREGIEVNLQNSTLMGYSDAYCNSEPITTVFLKNTLDFVLNNVDEGQGTRRWSIGSTVLIVNVESTDDLYIRNSSNSIIKRIPSGSASSFVCIYSGRASSSGGGYVAPDSIWYPIS